MEASDSDRSRSPVRSIALFPSASAAQPPPSFLSFDLESMELHLGHTVAKVYCSQAQPDVPWFQARPVVQYLGYTNVARTLHDFVRARHKKSLQDLVATQGPPIGKTHSTPITRNEATSIYLSEPGLYSLMFGSHRQEAKDFQCWVCEEVLVSIRRRGYYSAGATQVAATLRVELQQRDQAWQLTVQQAVRQSGEALQLAVQTAVQGAVHKSSEEVVAAVVDVKASVLQEC